MNRLFLILLLALLYAPPAFALEVADVSLDDTVTLDGSALSLNGAGVRKKLFISVYIGALYVEQKSGSADEILAQTGPSRILMHFLYKKLSADKLVDAWNEGFEGNLGEAQLGALGERIAQFNALFPDVVKGDVITLDYLPGQGTRMSVNDDAKGVVEGEDFHRALLRLWLGDKPATQSLKKAMLGG
ncbi:MAG: chalcone isomerase family protein [Gammaproteobacteria bacterium]